MYLELLEIKIFLNIKLTIFNFKIRKLSENDTINKEISVLNF